MLRRGALFLAAAPVLFGLATTACGSKESTTVAPDDQAAIKGAEATCDRPEVGLLTPPENASLVNEVTDYLGLKAPCTATLIANDVVITAAHCFAGDPLDGRAPSGQNLGTFKPNSGCSGATTTFSITRYHKLANINYLAFNPGHDLAIAQLVRHVPTSIAKPAKIAAQDPDDGDPMTWFGYGRRDSWFCGIKPQSDGQKAVYTEMTYPPSTFRVCPGDDGGPLFDSEGNLVSTVSNGAGFGDPVAHAKEITDLVTKWHAEGGNGSGPAAGTDGGTGSGGGSMESEADAGSGGSTDDAGTSSGSGSGSGSDTDAGTDPSSGSGNDTDAGSATGASSGSNSGNTQTEGSSGSGSSDNGNDTGSGSSGTGHTTSGGSLGGGSGSSSSGGCSQAPGGTSGGDAAFGAMMLGLAAVGIRRRKRA